MPDTELLGFNDVCFQMPFASFIQRDNIDLIKTLISIRQLIIEELLEKCADSKGLLIYCAKVADQGNYIKELTKILHDLEEKHAT